MANTIRLKRASGSDPGASDLVTGELAVRTDTGKLFTKKDDNSVTEIGATAIADGSITSAKIADGAIVNADVNASAAIAGSKIDPDFGSQTVTTTGTVNTGLINASSASDQILNLNSSDDGAVYLAFKRSGGRKAYFGYGGTGNTISLVNEISDGDINIAGSDGGSQINVLNFDVSDNGKATFSGDITTTGILNAGTAGGSDSVFNCNLQISNTFPTLVLNDTDSDNDFFIQNANGVFRITDQQNNAARLSVNSSGTVDVAGNLDVGAGVDVTGNITVSGTVDGRDVAADGTKLDGIESGATADQTKSDIDALGIAASTATTATNSNHIFVTDNEDTNENNLIPFIENASATGNVGLESDGHLFYNPSEGKLTSPAFAGNGAALTNLSGGNISSGTISASRIPTLNQNTTGSAATLTTARNIGGVSFDGSANINLPGVNTSGNQDTSGNAATATKLATARTIAGVSFDGSANISLNNNAITNGAGYLTSVGTSNISDDAVTYAKIQNVSTGSRILGRISGAGAIQELSASEARTLINVADGATNVTNNNQLTNGAGYITSADGGNAATLDSLDSSQFVRSDADDSSSGLLSLSTGLSLGANARCPAAVSSLSDGSTITVDFISGIHHSVTLGGNRTFGNPSNDGNAVGQSGSIFITQDGTGSRTASFHSDYKFVGGTAPTLSTAANAVDRLDYVIKASGVIHCVVSLDVK